MAAVVVENPLSGEAGLICEQHHCGKFGLLFNLVHNEKIGLHEGN